MKCRGFFLFSSAMILLPSLVAGQKYKIIPTLVTERLSGPVHSMEVMEAEGDQPPTSDKLQSLNIYDRDDFLTEDYSYDPETGSPEMHRVFTRGVDKKVTHVVTEIGDETRIVDIHEEHGVTIKEQRDGNGKLISRSEMTSNKQVFRSADDGDATRSTTTLTTTHDEDKAAGEIIDTVQRNDKILDQTITERTATGSVKVSREPNGSFSETTEDAHGGHLHTYNASEHMNVYLTFEDGYTVQAIYDKPDSYSRSTFT